VCAPGCTPGFHRTSSQGLYGGLPQMLPLIHVTVRIARYGPYVSCRLPNVIRSFCRCVPGRLA